jgi:hypothetical protein
MSYLAHAAFNHQEFRRRLQEDDPSLDEDTLADTVEGLTDLHEILAAIIRGALCDEALAFGLKSRVQEMHQRLGRLEERALIRRKIVRDVMVETAVKKIVDPEFTVSIRQGTPALIVVEEAAIPAGFWEARDPRLNKLALLAELKQGNVVPGVVLSNPEPTLSVRAR